MSKSRILLALCVAVTPALACKRAASDSGSVSAASPDQLGMSIADDYEAMLEEVNALTADRGPAAAVAPAVAEVKERYIREFVAYGEARAGMSPQERWQLDGVLASRSMALAGDPKYEGLLASIKHYKGDKELREELTSLIILTQYSDYELLKKQTPDEARRLGIE